MYNHHKRMLPKREDAYRTEFPGNYNNYNYSSSSVYSYSPTSTSDCPEHGRSRRSRRTTWILVTSVVLATLGVLSIAGLAAYLGIISKNISNNASLYEESYLQGNTTSTSRGVETSEEDDDILHNHGRSREESGFIDLTNSVSDVNTGLVPGDDDLINRRVKEPEIVADNFIKYKNTVSRPPEIVHGTKIKPNSNPPIQISAKPVNVIVQSTSVSSSSSSSSSSSTTTSNSNSPSPSSSINSNYYNPVDMIPPPVPSSSGGGGPENVITYFTEEPTSSRTPTRAPSRGNDRNRHRVPLTNSHSLMPSTTTTQTNNRDTLNDEEMHKSNSSTRDTIESSSKDKDGGSNTGTSSSSSGDVRYRSTLHKTSKPTSGHSGGVRESIVHVTPSDAKANRAGSQQSKDGHKYDQNAFAKRHGLVDDHDGEDVENSNPQRDTLMLHNSDDNQNNHRHKNNQEPNTSDEFGKGEEVSTSTVKFHSPTPSSSQQGAMPKNKSEYFMPITPIISSERPEEPNEDLLNNHKMPISFDRISPDFYDKNPWTPLLDRPNMDKRPRVDISRPSSTSPQGYTTSSPEPIIVWNTEYSHNDNYNEEGLRANSSPAPPAASPQNYYGYGHTAPGPFFPSNGNKEIRNQNAKPTLEFDDNEPISHGINTYSSSKPTATSPTHTKSSQEQMTVQVGVNNTTKKGGGTTTVVEPSSSYVEETTGGFRPLAIPSYTVIIPHIPNSPPKNGHEQGKGVTKGSQKPENAEAETDRNLNTSVQFDRVGLVELDEEDSGEKVQRTPDDKRRQSSDDNVNYRPNEHKTDNDHGNVENDMAKNEPEDIKEEDYGDNDELSGGNPSPTKIYKLDPDNIDIVPDTLGDTNTHVMESQDLKKPNSTATESDRLINHDSSSEKNNFYYHLHHSAEQETTPKMPDPIIKSTTDLIMSTLGSLNLIKSSPTAQAQRDDVESKLRASDFAESSESMEVDDDSNDDHDGGEDNDEPGVDSPLFPPVRSYVGVNLPLRPKPSPASLTEEDSGPNKKLRMSNDQGSMRPDFNAVSNLQKVLSMMMKFEGEDESRDLKADITPSVNVTKQNVNLILAKINEPTVTTTALPSPTTTSTHREQKSYKNRHSKIDEQFAPPSNVEHIPVPLIVTEPPKIPIVGNLPSNKMTLTNVTINDQNSPVYKFVLRQGQVEDLLKEIFLNYTDIQGEGDSPSTTEFLTQISASRPSTSLKNSSSLKSISNFHNLNDKSKTEQTTQNAIGVTFASVKINHPHLRPLSQSMMTTTSSSIRTSDAPVQTSTSIVINQDDETLEECPKNITFTCVSTGRCIPSYLRCNFIKECPDNSDESNCSCADFLRANGNGRKLCDGVVDCADGSDEYQVCEYCKPGQYICSGSRSCINKTQICDSKRDCPNGDDENDCVKIGQSQIPEGTDLEELSSTYNKNGHLMVRKKGVWGKLCVDTFSSVVSHWEVKDLARAVCKALTFSDFDSVERIQDKSVNSSTPYYELFYGVSNNDTDDSSPSSDDEPYSSESTPRVGLGFKTTECKSKLVVNVTCQDLQCGTAPKSFTQTSRYRVTRIVGGSNSNPGNWPWQAALYKSGSYQCGATLISSRWLLSAGHCFYNAQDDYWVARLGTLRRGAAVLSPYEQVVKITHIFLHPGYQNVGFVNDVSLLRLEKEVNFTDYVRPVCLPSRENKIRDGRMCTVVGWGQLQEVGRIFPDTLQEVQLPLISTSECRKRTLFLPLYKLTDAMFCAGFDRGGRDACLGDSGGGMMCPENDGRWSIYGVTSNGYGCARAARPGVYTKVASYLDWIHEKMSLENSFAFKEKPKHCSGHRCLLGECLEKRQVCNGIVDCIEDNGSDERGPNCTTHLGLAAT
ncbi:uncharacterized protein LOC110847008 isoform X2 [Folsomia candida]|uniref:uncharacterized protein LOC110847008 isoform X2 n=1 Tax=Folsomia candida TaxID=158441 RepID=UPI0016053FAB|nr:uncharacterized protein LOC110847008 isoform X2 [Folsomia candida]